MVMDKKYGRSITSNPKFLGKSEYDLPTKCRWCEEWAVHDYGELDKYCEQHNTEYLSGLDMENEYLCKFTFGKGEFGEEIE